VSIPLHTSTITVTRSTANPESPADPGVDPYDPPSSFPGYPNTSATVVSGVRAVITPTPGRAVVVGGLREVYDTQLRCDTIDLQPDDTVTDSVANQSWRVLTVTQVNAVGMIFTLANLRIVEGLSA
jgi:hypothetical protein